MSFEDTFRHELQRAGSALPVLGIDLERTMGEGRKARRRSMIVAGAAAVAIVGIGFVGIDALSRTGDSLPQPVGPSNTVETDETPTPDASPTVRRQTLEDAEQVLQMWLQAIQDSEEDIVWDVMTPEAQAIVGRERFDEMMASALPEGLGAFAEASHFSRINLALQGGTQAVVVASGEVSREGNTEFAAIAIPMRLQDGEVLVDDAFVDRDRFYDRVATFASESAGPFPARAGDDLVVEFTNPEGAVDVFIAVDHDRRPLPTRFDSASGEARATLDRDLDAGRHIATVVVVHRSGRLYPEAIIFTATAP